jgi:hypothetical protein
MFKTGKILGALPLACAVSAFACVFAPAAHAATVDVTPTSMGNWAFDNRDAGGMIGAESTASGGMVTGPATPPLGTGSANLATGNGTTGGDGAEEIRDTGYVGLALSSINALSYSTDATAWNGQQLPYLVLYLSNGDRLFFEPTYTPAQGAVALNTWQTWNAFTGNWYDDDGNGNPGVDNVISFSAMVADNPGATIVNQSNGLGGIRLTSGFASPSDQFNAYVDNVTINDTTFNFDPNAAATPLPGALPLFVSGIGAIGLIASRRKKKVKQ